MLVKGAQAIDRADDEFTDAYIHHNTSRKYADLLQKKSILSLDFAGVCVDVR